MIFVFRNVLCGGPSFRKVVFDFNLCKLGVILERQRKFELGAGTFIVNGNTKFFFQVR
jgi:hypothetical protein